MVKIMNNNANALGMAESLISEISEPKKIKYIKKEKGLLERAELDDNKTILVEDNRQILLG